MEKIINSPSPEITLAEWVSKAAGQALLGLPRRELTLNPNGSNSLVKQITAEALTSNNIAHLLSHLPNLSPEEISHRATKIALEPLKKPNGENQFGGVWNKWTACVAAAKLGLPQQKLSRIITKSGPTGQKLRQEQAKVAAQTEALIVKFLGTHIPDNIQTRVRLETWVNRLATETRLLMHKTKGLKDEKVVFDAVTAFIKILDFTPGQDLPEKSLREKLLQARLNQTPINLIDLHCPIFINSPTNGVIVDSSAESRVIETAEGKRIKIGHDGFFDGVCTFANILETHHIPHKIIILVIDNDKFVMPGQEDNIAQLVNSLPRTINQHPISKHNWKIVRASEAVSNEEFVPEWAIRNKRGDTITERLVDAEFDRLQSKTLPPEMKTRDFARSIARKAFVQQFAFGSRLSEVFDPAIIIQRTRAHQQASEIFRLGNKSCSKPGIIVAHWKNREEI